MLAESDTDQRAIAAPRIVVRTGGVEPPHPFGYQDLNLARMPVPPRPRGWRQSRLRWRRSEKAFEFLRINGKEMAVAYGR